MICSESSFQLYPITALEMHELILGPRLVSLYVHGEYMYVGNETIVVDDDKRQAIYTRC